MELLPTGLDQYAITRLGHYAGEVARIQPEPGTIRGFLQWQATFTLHSAQETAEIQENFSSLQRLHDFLAS